VGHRQWVAHRQWGHARLFGRLTVTPRKLTVERVYSYTGLARSDILGVEQTISVFPVLVTLNIRHPGGVMRIPWVRRKHAQEIKAALGFW
jgi:hypothetical protein